jgi:hypothetical protein
MFEYTDVRQHQFNLLLWIHWRLLWEFVIIISENLTPPHILRLSSADLNNLLNLRTLSNLAIRGIWELRTQTLVWFADLNFRKSANTYFFPYKFDIKFSNSKNKIEKLFKKTTLLRQTCAAFCWNLRIFNLRNSHENLPSFRFADWHT